MRSSTTIWATFPEAMGVVTTGGQLDEEGVEARVHLLRRQMRAPICRSVERDREEEGRRENGMALGPHGPRAAA